MDDPFILYGVVLFLNFSLRLIRKARTSHPRLAHVSVCFTSRPLGYVEAVLPWPCVQGVAHWLMLSVEQTDAMQRVGATLTLCGVGHTLAICGRSGILAFNMGSGLCHDGRGTG